MKPEIDMRLACGFVLKKKKNRMGGVQYLRIRDRTGKTIALYRDNLAVGIVHCWRKTFDGKPRSIERRTGGRCDLEYLKISTHAQTQ